MHNSIKKKPFDNLNLKTIRKEVSAVCEVYNQLSSIRLAEKDLLNSFAKSFGYKNWEQIVSVNKSRRYYLPFSFHFRCHVAAIIKNLIQELPKHVEQDILLIAASFNELSVTNVRNIFKFETNCPLDGECKLYWFTDNLNSPLKYLAESPRAAILRREGIFFKHFKILWPEVSVWLQRKFDLRNNSILMFAEPIWWRYCDHLSADFLQDDVGHWEVDFMKKGLKRTCYHPISAPSKGSSLAESLQFDEFGLFDLEPVTLDETQSIEVDLLQCLQFWKSLPHVTNIRITFSEMYEHKLEHSLRSLLSDYLAQHNQEIEAKRKQLTKLDLTGAYSSFEERLVKNAGRTKIYNEEWIEQSELEKFKEINTLIQSELANQGMLQPKAAIDAIDNYKKAFYRFG
ncbi:MULTISPECIES: hypothetical protein [unclassified Alteromonas]|uniref:hypothetical protein n=1 Tax=unclassified Alteromonas TaxID=2614992 RepID=UPI0005098309|nr:MULTISPECIES: hypothetical protein [unclassified Alteromonas]